VLFSIEEHRALGAGGAILERVESDLVPYYSTPYGKCPWFDAESRNCTIYDKRPKQCREAVPGSDVARSRGCIA
jgi:Fe-S-cluster containining protein